MGRDRAAYMREYRKRKAKAGRVVEAVEAIRTGATIVEPVTALARIRELEAEVTRLKRELAARPIPDVVRPFNSRPFTAVPKRGK